MDAITHVHTSTYKLKLSTSRIHAVTHHAVTQSRTCAQELNLKDEPMNEVAPAKDDGGGGFPRLDEDDDLLALMDQASEK